MIDEIDKADIEFPNDLLQELDRMEFFVYELGQTIKAKHRPIVIITSNNEKELPDAFLEVFSTTLIFLIEKPCSRLSMSVSRNQTGSGQGSDGDLL